MDNNLYLPVPSLYISKEIYSIFILVIVLLCSFLCIIKKYNANRPILNNKIFTGIVFIFILIHFTFRPPFDELLSSDTVRYANRFLVYKYLDKFVLFTNKEIFFTYMTYLLSKIVSLTAYIGFLALLYLLPLIYFFKNTLNKNYFLGIIMYVTYLFFWPYGVIAVRQGIAASLFIAGLSLYKFQKKQLFLFLFAILFHTSLALSVFFYYFNLKCIKSTKYYLIFWLLSIPLYFTIGHYIGGIVSTFSDRFQDYYVMEVSDIFSQKGFKSNFVLYSTIPVILGSYYTYKLKYKDFLYSMIFNIYLSCNACWIIINDISSSDRFAFMSWSLMPIVMTYPLIKDNIVKNQSLIIAALMLLNYTITLILIF